MKRKNPCLPRERKYRESKNARCTWLCLRNTPDHLPCSCCERNELADIGYKDAYLADAVKTQTIYQKPCGISYILFTSKLCAFVGKINNNKMYIGESKKKEQQTALFNSDDKKYKTTSVQRHQAFT